MTIAPRQRRGEGDDPPRAALRRIGDDDEFFVFARGVAPGGDGRTRCRVRACRNRDRRPQYACGRRARACLRARKQGGARGHARRSGRAARLRRRNARRPRLSEGPRGLRPALPHSHGGKSARAEGRVPAEIGGSFGAWRGAADCCDARRPSPERDLSTGPRQRVHPSRCVQTRNSSVAFGDTFSRKREKDAPLSRKGVERRPSLDSYAGKGEGDSLPPPRSLRPAALDRREPDLRRGHAGGARRRRGAGEKARRAAHRDQRCADACARAPRARRCLSLHP